MVMAAEAALTVAGRLDHGAATVEDHVVVMEAAVGEVVINEAISKIGAIMITHSELVKALVKRPDLILETLDDEKVDLMHAGFGIFGESGELLDAIKKHIVYNKPLDRENVVEELGDMEFYMEQLRQRLGITREETLEHNIMKLSERYAGIQYSDRAAQERADKNGGNNAVEERQES